MKRQKKTEAAGDRLSTGRVFSNIWYMFRLIHRCSPGMIFFQVAFSVFGALTGFLTGAFLLRQIVSGVTEGRSFRELLLVAAVLFGAQLVTELLSTLFYSFPSDILQNKLNRNLEQTMFRKAVSWELACFENTEFYNRYAKAGGNLLNRCYGVLWGMRRVCTSAASLVANVALLLAVDPVLSLFALLPCLAMPMLSLRNKREYKMEQRLRELDRNEDYCYRSFYDAENAKEMRLSSIYRPLLERFRRASAEGVEMYRKQGFSLALLGYLVYAFRNVFASLGAVAYAAYRTIVQKTMPFADCVVVIPLVSSIAGTVETLTDQLGQFRTHARYVEDVRSFMEYEPAMRENPDGMTARRGELSLRDVSFRYAGAEDDALRHVSLTVRPGEKIAVVGQNGAGKSTLVKLLMRLYDPTEGTVTLDGTDCRDYRLTSYRAAFASVFQDCRGFGLSIMENVLLRPVREGDEALVTEALRRAGLLDKVSALPKGIHTNLTREFDKEGAVFSGGELQKLAIAHIYTTDSTFVILDEPTSALDPVAEADMYRTMAEACRGRGMIFISHRMSSATDADRIYMMEHGAVAETGTHRELMAKNGLYAEMFRKQAQNYLDGGEEAANRGA